MKRIGLALMVALWGGLVASVAVWEAQSFGGNWDMIFAATAGAFVSGWLVAPLFVRAGWPWFALAAVTATTLGGSIGGAIIAGTGLADSILAGVAVGAIFPWDLALHSVATAAVWAISAAALWKVTRRYSLK